MPNNEIINNMIRTSRAGLSDATLYLIDYYRPLVIDIVSSLDIKQDQEDFIEEGLNAIICAINTYDFKDTSFDSYVKSAIQTRIDKLVKGYYEDYMYLQSINILPNRLNGENIYESIDSSIDIDSNLDSFVICDGEKLKVVDVLFSSNDDTEIEALNNILREEIAKLIAENNLIQLEVEVLKSKYGFCMTVEEISNKLNISQQDVERLLNKTLFKLRTCFSIKMFSGYMEDVNRALDYIGYFQDESFYGDKEKNAILTKYISRIKTRDNNQLSKKINKML